MGLRACAKYKRGGRPAPLQQNCCNTMLTTREEPTAAERVRGSGFAPVGVLIGLSDEIGGGGGGEDQFPKTFKRSSGG